MRMLHYTSYKNIHKGNKEKEPTLDSLKYIHIKKYLEYLHDYRTHFASAQSQWL